MDRVVSHVRRVGLASVALLSVAVGVGTIWVVASPDAIGATPTWILLGVFGLMTLPMAAAAALALDRRNLAARRVDRHADESRGQDDAALSGPASDAPVERRAPVAHVGHGELSDVHRHRHQRSTATHP